MVDFLIFAATTVAIWSVVAISLNLQFGLTGLVNFGQILPFALGAFGVAIAKVHGLTIAGGIGLGIGLSILAAVVVLVPVRRLAQDYWALVTLGAAEIVRLAFVNFAGLAGGVDGAGVDRVTPATTALGLSLLLLAVAVLLAMRIDRSPLGRFLRVIREDEVLAASLGRRPFRYQLLVTIISWAMAGAAGVLYAHFVGYVSPDSFKVSETFMIWTAVIVGGPGSILGAIVGMSFVQLLSVATRFAAQWSGLPYDLVANLRLLVFGLLLVLAFLFRRQGLIPERKVVTRAHDQ
ncbi:branched-chain amino acid ABC transporter permease [Acuticoccus kandeliae]|uniref:branched-chain amino acid ABC transporter permease n=1 Tax=Acuticoccus kandeliae TaxID=2073160 RepID=UPI000D3E74FB|nr:branched-chain amino acid ABC transporter permease [Acuticoccus kandeliae]